MDRRELRPSMALLLIAVAILAGMAVAGARSLQKRNQDIWSVSRLAPGSTPQVASSGTGGIARLAPTDSVPLLTPTPDAPHALPNLRTQVEQHTVQPGESLGRIAQRYSVSLPQIVEENQLADPNLLEVGQVLTIPLPDPSAAGPAFKIIPDSELVNGPAAVGFDIAAFIQEHGGYLARHTEEVDGRPTSGAQIVERVALEYSVNPRLLLAVLEYQGGWLSNPDPKEGKKDYPIGVRNPSRKGLYYELSWAANNLNRGYYLWRVNGIGAWLLGDGDVVPINSTINAGTAGVQHMFSVLYTRSAWEQAVGESGVYAVYRDLFGNPFRNVVEPLVPADLQQPAMQLPFEPGKEWSFTGGPHGGWGDGSAWAALDFAPPGEALGCVLSNEWVTAVADGLVVRSADGVVVQDLDGDGNEQTGWAVMYLHVDQQERAPVGKYLAAGERIGHPSCEGGVSAGTHVHLARKYNGEWISADQQPPFNLEGWVSSSLGQEYDGYLERGGRRIEAYDGRAPENAISR